MKGEVLVITDAKNNNNTHTHTHLGLIKFDQIKSRHLAVVGSTARPSRSELIKHPSFRSTSNSLALRRTSGQKLNTVVALIISLTPLDRFLRLGKHLGSG